MHRHILYFLLDLDVGRYGYGLYFIQYYYSNKINCFIHNLFYSVEIKPDLPVTVTEKAKNITNYKVVILFVEYSNLTIVILLIARSFADS